MKNEEVKNYAWTRTEVVTHPKSRDYFSHLALTHLPEMKLLIGGGKLTKKDEWRNVVQHCLVQIGVMDVMCDLLSVSPDDKKKLLTVAGSHDWKKRIEITGADTAADPAWKKKIDLYLESVKPDESLMAATGPEFIAHGLKGESSLLQEIAFYVDDIVSENMVVPSLDRLYENKLKKGVKKLDADERLTDTLGGLRYSDAEIKLASIVERKLVNIITKNNDVSIESPESLPTLILSELNRRITSFGKLAGQ